MAKSTIESLSFDDDDDETLVASSRSCWRFGDSDDDSEPQKVDNVSNEVTGGHTVVGVVKQELIEDSNSQSPTLKKKNVSNVGNISLIKDKSNAEREYAANAVKKVRDLLKDSESNNEESECVNDQKFNIPVSQGSRVFTNKNTSQPQRVEHFAQPVETSSWRQNVIETHSMVESLSSSSVTGSGSSSVAYTSEATSSNNQVNQPEFEPAEQVIKLIHTRDATLPYMCSACNMHSSNLGVMKQHIADHKKGVIKCPLLGLSKNVFICPFGNCDFSSPNYARVLTHLNRFHGREAQHLIKQITSSTLPEAVAALNDPVSPLCKRESIWKEVALQNKKPTVQTKLYACSECDYKDYDFKVLVGHLQEHIKQNKKQKTG